MKSTAARQELSRLPAEIEPAPAKLENPDIPMSEPATTPSSEERFRTIITNCADGILIVAADGAVRFANPAACLLFGRDETELRSEGIGFPTASPSFEIQIRRPDGAIRTAELRVVPIVWEDQPCSLASLRDITMHKELADQLRLAHEEQARRVDQRTDQLNAAHRELEALSYYIAHDLRAPLRSIDGWSLAVTEDCAESLSPRAQLYLDRVRTEAQRMGHMIDGLLDLSHVVRAHVRPESVNLSHIVAGFTDLARQAHPGRSFDFRIEPGITCPGDRWLLTIALTKLLENALKFTNRRHCSEITFGLESTGPGCGTYFVRDNGAGFDMAFADNLFVAFRRLHKPSEFPGTGMGLATAQRAIARHGGRLWAEAEPDRGATFYFTVPDPPLTV